jgi:hypothetical protein
MADHIVIDASRQPAQIRCLHCGFAQDLRLPMAIHELVALERWITFKHRKCKRQQATSNPTQPAT